MSISGQGNRPSFEQIEYRFYSNHALEEMRDVLSAAGARSWFWRQVETPHLSTSSSPPGHAGDRWRIDPLPEAGNRFHLTAWYFAGHAREAIREAMWAEVLLPLDAAAAEEQDPALGLARAGHELTGFELGSPLSLPEMCDPLNRQTPFDWVLAGETLRAIQTATQKIEEIRWRITPRGNGFQLDLLYLGNPHDEERWRATVALAHRQVLPAIEAAGGTATGGTERETLAAAELEELTLERYRALELQHPAWSFRSELTQAQMKERLAGTGDREWMERDSHWYGDYLSSISSAPYDEVLKLRIFEEKERFVLDVRFHSEHPDAERTWAKVQRWVLQIVLPAIEARDIRPDEGYD